jgi:hypothetical protein
VVLSVPFIGQRVGRNGLGGDVPDDDGGSSMR